MPSPRNLALRHYIYRSRSKISSLFEQLFVEESTGVKRSVSLNLGALKGAFETDTQRTLTLTDKLGLVETELEARGLVGTLAEPNEYVRGSMLMRYGMFDDSGRRGDAAPLVYFGGIEKDCPMIVGLGGSASNVDAFEGITSTWSRSYTAEITRWLLAGAETNAPPDLPEWWDMEGEKQKIFTAMAVALKELRPPTMRMEFLARNLLAGNHHTRGLLHIVGFELETRFLLGTPVFVSQASLLPDENRFGLDQGWDEVGPDLPGLDRAED